MLLFEFSPFLVVKNMYVYVVDVFFCYFGQDFINLLFNFYFDVTFIQYVFSSSYIIMNYFKVYLNNLQLMQ